VAVTNDGTVENTETFTARLVLTAATPLTGYATDLTDTGNGTILDNDTATFLINNDLKKEGASPLSFSISLSAPVDVDTKVNVSLADTTTSGGDFTHSVQQVTFAANSTTAQTITGNFVLSKHHKVKKGTFTLARGASPSGAFLDDPERSVP